MIISQSIDTHQSKGSIYTDAIRFLKFLLILLLAACDASVKLKPLGQSDVVLAFGDSLTYGTGVSPEYAYPVALSQIINRKVINAGVPGETSQEALLRLPALLDEYHPRLVILCTGGNDMLRKFDLAHTEAHIRKMIEMIQNSGAEAVLVGVPKPALISSPPHFYKQVSSDFKLIYDGEILNRILKNSELKSDAVHANEKGYRLLAETLAEHLKDAGAIQ